MGCGVSSEAHQQVYSVILGKPGINESEVRRHPLAKDNLTQYPDENTKTLQDVLYRSVGLYGNRPYLGTQQNVHRILLSKNVYVFETYGQVFQKAQHIGSGLINLNLAPPINEFQNLNLRLVGVFAKNRPEWVILDWANLIYGATMVPFYDTLGAESIPFILQQTNLKTIFIAAQPIKTLLQLKQTDLGCLKNIVLLDQIPQEDKTKLESLGLKLLTWDQVIQSGQQETKQKVKAEPDQIYTFSYTSGTTGNPKGALLSHGNFVSTLATIFKTSITMSQNDAYLSYLPLPHVMERLALTLVLYAGASVGFYRGDPNLLKEDISRLRPTFFVSVPRLYNKFYDGIRAKIEAVQGAKRSFAEKAINVKLQNLRTKAEYTHFLYDKAFAAVRELFGGRVRFMITGSAPIAKDVIDFLKIACSCPIYEGYGQTESTGGSFMTLIWDPNSGHVGGPTSNTEFKLQDVPDMNYRSTDLDVQARPQPRGEICIRGPGVFKGYYKDIEKTKEAIDEDGWLHTGDVGMILPSGNLRIIDRKKNIFKLSQGEYIAPEKVENIYLRAKGVAEAFVYGDSLQNNVVGIIVPHKNQDYVEAYAKTEKIPGTFEELCKHEAVIKHMLDNITVQGKAEKLNSLEQVKAIYLEPQSFSLLGCMTTTFKLQRHQAKIRFQEQIDNMYSRLQQQQAQLQQQ